MMTNIDVKTTYGGLSLRSPVIVGACPLSMQEQTRVSMESAGAGAIVLPSLFEEQVIRWSEQSGRAVTDLERALLARAQETNAHWACEDAERYLALVGQASSHHSVPIIASLNGYTAGGWTHFAAELEQAGAAGIELNVHHPPEREYHGPREIEETIVEAVGAISSAISIPLFVKLDHRYTSLPHLARKLMSGCQGLVLHGRSPDVDICLDSLKLKTHWGLTQPGSVVQTLGTILQVHGYCPALPIAASGGIAHTDDLIKALLAGADVAMVTSAIYREGPDVIRSLLDGLNVFMERHRMLTLRQLQLSRPIEFASEQERATYMAALSSRLDASETHTDDPVLRGDRWGHPDLSTE